MTLVMIENLTDLPSDDQIRRAPAVIRNMLLADRPGFYALQPIKRQLVERLGPDAAGLIYLQASGRQDSHRIAPVRLVSLHDLARRNLQDYRHLWAARSVSLASPFVLNEPQAAPLHGTSRAMFFGVVRGATVSSKSNYILTGDIAGLDFQNDELLRCPINFDVDPAILQHGNELLAVKPTDTVAERKFECALSLLGIIEFYSGLLRPGQFSLIDIGCGTGTITAAMAKDLRHLNPHSKVRVAGLDGSAAMLAVAAQRDPGIEWILGDIRQPPVKGPFELAISCYNTLQHLDDIGLAQAIRSVRLVLPARGRFAFDIYQPNLPYIRIPQVNRLARSISHPDGRNLEIREDSVFEEAARMLDIHWRLVEVDRDSSSPLIETRFQLWQHTPDRVSQLLVESGFAIKERLGGLDRSEFLPTSKKQVVVCEAV